MDVVGGIGAAHVERGGGALRAQHPEPGEEFLHDVEIRGAQALCDPLATMTTKTS